MVWENGCTFRPWCRPPRCWACSSETGAAWPDRGRLGRARRADRRRSLVARRERSRVARAGDTAVAVAEGPPADRTDTASKRSTDGPLVGIPAMRHFFRTNEVPVYFVSATAFNLLGIDRWVRNFKFVNYYDSFDGWHPNVFVPKEQSPRTFESIEHICNYLLGHKEVVDYVRGRGPGGKVAFLMFDEETETLAAELGLEVAFPR